MTQQPTIAMIGTGTTARQIVPACDPIVAYTDLDERRAVEFARVAPHTAEWDSTLRRLSRRAIDVYLVTVPSEQVPVVLSTVLTHNTVRPVLFLVTADCDLATLVALQELRNAHPGVGVAFWRPLRYAAWSARVRIRRVSTIHVRHSPLLTTTTYPQSLIGFALSLAQAVPDHRGLGVNRYEVNLEREGDPVAAKLTLAPEKGIEKFAVWVKDEQNTVALLPHSPSGGEPSLLMRRLDPAAGMPTAAPAPAARIPLGLTAHRWLLHQSSLALRRLSPLSTPGAIDDELTRHGIAGLRAECIATGLGEHCARLRASANASGR